MSEWGAIVTAWQVEQAVKTTLQAWLDTALGELERQSAGRWALRSVRRPPHPVQSWEIVSEYHDIPGRILPAISIESRTMADAPEVHEGGRVDGAWDIVVQAVVKGKTRTLSRDLLSMYEAAIRTILTTKGSLGGFAVATKPGASNMSLITSDRDRTLVGCEVPCTVTVAAINQWGNAPLTPDAPLPTPLPPASPSDAVHTSTTVTVTPE